KKLLVVRRAIRLAGVEHRLTHQRHAVTPAVLGRRGHQGRVREQPGVHEVEPLARRSQPPRKAGDEQVRTIEYGIARRNQARQPRKDSLLVEKVPYAESTDVHTVD